MRNAKAAGKIMTPKTSKRTDLLGVGEEVNGPMSLAEIGISYDESSRYQKLANMPEEHFETAIETAKQAAGRCCGMLRRRGRWSHNRRRTLTA